MRREWLAGHYNLKRQRFRLIALRLRRLHALCVKGDGVEVALLVLMTVEMMDRPTRAEYEREIDVALAGSFPASDPLPWTLGVALEPAPREPALLPRPRAAAEDVVYSATRGYRRFAAIAEVFGLGLLVPIGILLIGIPIAAAVSAALSVLLR